MPSPADTSSSDHDASMRFAQTLADAASPLTLGRFRQSFEVDTKRDESPVTIADRETEAELRAMIARRYPDHGILGEEHGRERLDAEYVWVIDPIDGTRSFISGWPLWGTLIALLRDGRPLLGVIDAPAVGERWSAQVGEPTRLNGEPCRVSGCETLAEARFYTTSPFYFAADERKGLDQVMEQAALVRFGGDCYGYGLLASGHIDLIIETGLEPYDYLALVTVVEGAGGVISDWRGRPLGLDSCGQVIAAASTELHRQALAMIAAAAR